MKIKVNHEERIFCVKINGNKYFCNLNHIPTLLTKNIKVGQKFSVSHLWNNKFETLNKKELNEMFEYNDIRFKIN